MKCISRSIISAASLALALSAECVKVAGEWIHAADLGIGNPVREKIGFAPRPGAQRHFSRADLALLGAAAPPATGICVERESEELTAAMLQAALSASLPPQAKVELLDWPRIPVPRGRLRFPESGLRMARPEPATGIVQLRGYVEYDGRKRFPLWVRAHIAAPVREWLLTCPLPARATVETDCIKERETDRYPFAPAGAAQTGVEGRRLRQAAPAGTVLRETMLLPREDVRLKEEIELTVVSGAARLKLRAVSESAAAVGQTISVSVDGSRRRLRAQLVEKGRAELIVNGGGS